MKKISITLLLLAIILTLFLPTQLLANSSEKYLDENGMIQTQDNCIELVEDLTEWGTEDTTTWYIVKNDLTLNNRPYVKGNVHLILADNATLTANIGISVTENHSLTIYAQSTGANMGKLIAKGYQRHPSNHYYAAGIGGYAQEIVGNITIHGGNITAYGGGYAAGIGGGYYSSGGGGKQHGYGGGNITITGGIIDATNENNTSGIGAGKSDDPRFALQGSQSNFSTGANGNAIIKTNHFVLDNQNLQSGVIFEGNIGNVYGNVNLPQNLTITSNETLTVMPKSTLTISNNIILTNNGTIINNGNILLDSSSSLAGSGLLNIQNGSMQGITPEGIHLIGSIDTSEISNITHNISQTLDNQNDLSAVLTPNENYTLPNFITVSINGKELTSDKYIYNNITGELLIPAKEIRGNIKIIASADKIIPKYKITINPVEGAIISTSSNPDEVLEGTDFKITIKADNGYKITSIKVNNIEQELPLQEDVLTLTNISSDMNIDITTEKVPETAEKNEISTILEENNNISNSPKTGDTTHITLWAILATISIFGIIYTIKYIKKNAN